MRDEDLPLLAAPARAPWPRWAAQVETPRGEAGGVEWLLHALTSEQQAAHRVAARGIAVKQKGQSFVFAGGGGAAFNLLTALTIKKTTMAIMES